MAMETNRFALEIGQFVRERRKASRLNQHDLSALAGVGQRFVSELERGKATVRLAEVDKVLEVFGKQLGLVERTGQSRTGQANGAE